jgi:hypothetical protein
MELHTLKGRSFTVAHRFEGNFLGRRFGALQLFLGKRRTSGVALATSRHW